MMLHCKVDARFVSTDYASIENEKQRTEISH